MLRIFFGLACATLLSSCSVYKAASNEGVAVSDIEECRTVGALLSNGMQRIDAKEYEGNIVEVYRAVARKSGINYGRAVGHGVLDVCTLGLWEIAGTPIEGAMDNNRGYIVAKITRANSVTEEIKEMMIYDSSGKCAVNKKFK